jgi:hypothetical protein
MRLAAMKEYRDAGDSDMGQNERESDELPEAQIEHAGKQLHLYLPWGFRLLGYI